MTAGEHQSQPVVLDILAVQCNTLVGEVLDLFGEIVEREKASAPPYSVNRLEASGRHKPAARIGRYTLLRPLFESRLERIVQRFLGDVEVTEEANQRGEYAARLGTVDTVHDLAHLFSVCVFAHPPQSLRRIGGKEKIIVFVGRKCKCKGNLAIMPIR